MKFKHYKVGTIVKFSEDVFEDEDIYHIDIDECDSEDDYLDYAWVFDNIDISYYKEMGVGKIIKNSPEVWGNYLIKFKTGEVNLPHYAVELVRRVRELKCQK